MKRLYLTFSIIICLLELSAQDYLLMVDGNFNLYENGDDLRAIRVDSTASDEQGTIQYLSNTVQDSDTSVFGTCFTPYGPSWTGPEIRVQDNGTQLLFNRTGDTIRLEMQRNLGDPWIAYAGNDRSVRATITEVELDLVLGMLDSIRTVEFQALDADGIEIDVTVNQKILRVSKNRGAIRLLNFLVFPSGTEHYYQHGLREYDLVGREGNLYGINNLTWKDVFDFQPGDELHLKRGVEWSDGYEYRYIYRYLQREEIGDSIRYLIERSYDKYDYDTSEWDWVYAESAIDTMETWVAYNPQFDQWSRLPFFGGSENSSYANFFTQKNDFPVRKTIFEESTYLELFPFGNDCWEQIFIDDYCPGVTPQEYIMGKGGPYYDCVGGFWGDRHYRILQYSLLDGLETGTPFDLVVEAPVAEETVVRVYPVPASDAFTIESKQEMLPAVFRLTDVSGKILKNHNISMPVTEIAVSDLPPGIYLYSILTVSGRVINGKAVIAK